MNGVETVGESATEVQLRIRMESGESLRLVLPVEGLGRLYEQIEKNKPDP